MEILGHDELYTNLPLIYLWMGFTKPKLFFAPLQTPYIPLIALELLTDMLLALDSRIQGDLERPFQSN